MNTLPQISYQVPPELHIITDNMVVHDRLCPVIVTAPLPNYIDLMVAIDGAPPKRLARWCNSFNPWTYVVYQPEVLAAKLAVFSFVVHPGAAYPAN